MLQFFIEFVGGLRDFGRLAQPRQVDFERRHILRPDQATLIGKMLGQQPHQPADANAVAAHDDRLRLAGFIGKVDLQRIGVFTFQRENIAYFHAALFHQFFLFEAEFGQHLIRINFFIDGHALLLMDVDGVLADVADGLKLIAKPAGKNPAVSVSAVGDGAQA